jgi:uncharacterized cupin superfamily protein
MLIKFDEASIAGEEYYLPAEKLLHGNPKQTVLVHYTDATGKFVSGVWRSEPGKWTISYTEEEFCHMLEGRSIVTENNGNAVVLVAGDSFVIPRGFIGTWEVVERSTKQFAIYEPDACIPAP